MASDEIVFNPAPTQTGESLETSDYRKSQIDNLQASLASVTGQLLSMQETLGEKELEINDLRKKLTEASSNSLADKWVKKEDQTLTLVQALINLYTLLFLPRKVE